jgi:L-ascorbate metabolism protein UlaG (beta-lactamase superfamily)
MTRMRGAWLGGTLLLLCGAGVVHAAAPPALELTYLGNEGVLLAVGEQQVAIDALHREFPRPPHYEHLPPAQLQRLETAQPPFSRLRVHLTTHVHDDHFHPESVARFLAASPAAVAVVPREAPSRVCPGKAACAPLARLRVREKDWGPERELQLHGVHVRVLDLPHAKGARTQVENLGYLVTLGGMRILHVGDAHLSAETFARFKLPERRLDVALVPYWFLLEEEGRRLVHEHLGARRVVAFHVPPSEHERVAAQLREVMPEVVVLTRMMETVRL